MKKRELIQNIVEYIFTIFLVLSCNTIYGNTINKNYYVVEFLFISLIIAIFITIINGKIEKKALGKTILFIIFYIFYISIFFLINNISNIYNFVGIFYIYFPLIYFFISCYKKTDSIKLIAKKFVNIVCILSIFSMIIYIIGPILKIIGPSEVVFIEWGKELAIKSYYNLHFLTQTESIFGMTIVRNTSIFTEAPMYSLVLTIALGFELFITKEKRKKVLLMLIFSIISTISTTGIIVAIIMILADYIISMPKKNIYKLIKLLLIPIFLTIGTYISYQLYNEKVGSLSYNVRIDDYKASYKAWKINPIFGNGYKNNEIIKQYMDTSRYYNTGLSNSILVVLAQCGLYLYMFYLIPFLLCIRYGIKNKEYSTIVFATSILVLFSTTIIMYLPIMITMLAMGYSIKNKRRIQNEKDINC